MGNPNESRPLAEQFKCRYYKSDDSVLFPIDDDSKYVGIVDPAILASFVAFCSRPGNPIFLRGSTDRHRHSVPSLFRDPHGKQCDAAEMNKRWRAYKSVLNRLCQLPGTRWDQEAHLGAVLQHYGLRTPWLDVVRNLYTAIWFATHDFETRGHCLAANTSDKDHGHISLYDSRPERKPCLKVVDLWGDDSSRHLRPHAQHGRSLARQGDDSHPECQQDLAPYRIAHVRFPNSRRWTLCGHMFSARFLFPAPEHDESLKQLTHPEVETVLEKACDSHGLVQGTLGKVSHYM